MVWVETPTNPLIKVSDIQALSKVIHAFGDVIFAVDNTFLTSYFQRPLELGADLVCYSLTKYMNGHSDVVMGGVTTNSEELYGKLKFLQNGKLLKLKNSITLTSIISNLVDCLTILYLVKTKWNLNVFLMSEFFFF